MQLNEQITAEDRVADFALGVPRMPIRPCSLDDIPWLLENVAKNYPEQPIDFKKTETYWRATIGRKDHVYLRGAVSAGCSRLGRAYWLSDTAPPSATDLFYFANKNPGGIFEIIMIMRKMIDWARACGCEQYSFAATTGADVSIMAKRLGARSSHARYVVPLKRESPDV